MASAGSVQAAPLTFTVNEGAVPGANPTVLTTPNDITGKYQESLILGPGNTFQAYLVVNFTSYVNTVAPGGAALVASQLDATVVGGETSQTNLYSMYALVTASGTYSSPSANQLNFQPTTASANIYLDPTRNTTKDYTTATATGGTADDLLIMTASTIDQSTSTGAVFLNGSTVLGGFYALSFTNPAIVGTGNAYWPTLSLLSLKATASGDVDTSQQGSIFPGSIVGDTDITFEQVSAVPEPASMILLGSGLLGVAARRRKKQQ